MLDVGDNLHWQPNPCVDEHFISSSLLYLSSFYPCTSVYSSTTIINVKNVFNLTLVSKNKNKKSMCIDHVQQQWLKL